MAAPLTDADREVLRYTRLVCLVARRLSAKWPLTDVRDLECVCWGGLWRGLKSFDRAEGKLLPHLWLNCWGAGNDYALREAKRGLAFAPRSFLPRVTSPAGLGRRPDGRHEYRPWEEADWRHVLGRLSPRPARAVELRFRFDRTYKEIAAEMGFGSPKAASTAVWGAMRTLRKLVKRGVIDP